MQSSVMTGCGYGYMHGMCVVYVYGNVSCLAHRQTDTHSGNIHKYTDLPSLVYAKQSEW